MRIVCVDQRISLARNKQFTKFSAVFFPYGDILQVRIGTGKPPRRRHGLVVSGMDQTVFDKRTDPFDISGKQFLDFAIAQNKTGDLVFFRQFFKDFGIGGISAADILFKSLCIVTEFFEQYFGKLERRIEVKGFTACKGEYFFGKIL